MRKTLLSVLAGLAVIGSATAVPSPGDRKKLCESKPYDFVWVEKTQTCVPINPCRTSNQSIRDSYCIWASGYVTYGTYEEAITRYVKNVMKTGVKSISSISKSDDFALRTTDGGYYVVSFDRVIDGYDDSRDATGVKNRLMTACWAYGKTIEYDDKRDDRAVYGCAGVNSDRECTDIADFASLLFSEVVDGKIEQLGQSICWLSNYDGWWKREVKDQEFRYPSHP